MRRSLAGAVAAASLLVAACGDDSATSGPTSGPTSSSAPGSAPADGTTPGTEPTPEADGEVVTDDGRERTYRLHVPESVGDDPVPLLVALHGGGGSPDQFAGENGLEDLADEEGFVVVHPAGIPGRLERLHTWNAGNCCGVASAEGVDDVAFIRAVVEEVSGALPIDPDRVFAIGHSNGGMMAYRLACEAPDVFAAVGHQAGALGIEGCEPSTPVSLIHVHGTADTNVPLEGGVGSGVAGVVFRSTIGSVETVTLAQGCEGEPTDEIDVDNPALSRSTWSCPDGAEVQLALVEGGAHGWFGGSRAEGRDGPSSVDSSTLIWAFLATHPRR